MSRRMLAIVCLALIVALLGAQVASLAKSPHKIKVFDKKAFTTNLGKDLVPQEETVAEQAAKWAQFDLTLSSDKKAYRIGEAMDVTVTSDRDCYVIVYYVNAAGKTAIVCPSPFSPDNRVKAHYAWSLLDKRGHKLIQGGPEGTETLQVVATEQPIDLSTLPGLKLPGAAARATTTASHPTTPDPASPEMAGTATPTGDKVAASSTVDVTNADEFVDGAGKCIRQRVKERCRKLARRSKKDIENGDFETTDSVFGLGSLTYQVTK